MLRAFLFVLACEMAASMQLAAADDSPVTPAGITPADAEFFEAKVRPLLIARCLECHVGEKAKSGLRLDSREALLNGGDSGPAAVVGKPAESLLMDVISYRGNIQMPPKAKLPDAEIATLTEWVRRGLPWPNSKPASPKPSNEKPDGPRFTEEQRAFWAFQPVRPTVPPDVKGTAWVRSPIDRFLLAEMEAKSLAPVREADRRTLLRRVSFDLIGLPPTPDEVADFLADSSPDAFERVIDRLLASPRYGERWGRHWLDVARYADSNGLDENLAYASAHHYRDYVVKSFRDDKPYDQFLVEQVAGDLLSVSSDESRVSSAREDIGTTSTAPVRIDPPSSAPLALVTQHSTLNPFDALTATGFLSLGAKMLAEDDPVKMQMDIIDEQVDTLSRAVLGLTMGCARCHDHKFDPLTMDDYYGLAGVFKSTKTMDNFSVVARWHERPLATPEQLKQRDEAQQRVASQKQATDKRKADAAEAILARERKRVAEYLLAATHDWQRAELLKTAKPRGDDPAVKGIAGAFLIEAEDYVRGNVSKDRDAYGNGIGVLVNRGETPNFAEYDLDVPRDATYQFELRYAAAGSRPVKVFWDGTLIKTDAAKHVTGTWLPDSQKWFVESLFAVKAGRHTLRLEQPMYFPHIDKLLLVPVEGERSAIADVTVPKEQERQNRTDDIQPSTNQETAKTKLLPSLIEQWVKTLDATKDKPESVLAPWHQFVKSGQFNGDDSSPATGVVALLGQTPPKTLIELADRYSKLFADAEARWTEFKLTDEGKNAKGLNDPVLESARMLIADPKGPFATPQDIETHFPVETVVALKADRDELVRLEQVVPKFTEVMAVADAEPVNLKLHLRGSHLTLGREVPRQLPQILAGGEPQRLSHGSGRLELARWLASPSNPLTSRVMVNRVWQGHFGFGLVRSVDNFGLLGERPTHPALLDWLADEFAKDFSIKRLHRRLVATSAYRTSTANDPTAALADPENRLLWRAHRRRLEVEPLRDAMLYVSGLLDETPGGTMLPTPNRNYVTSTANVNPAIYNSNRRSVYLPVVRSALYEVFTAFDFADPSTLNGQRDQTTVAPQALFMMNSEFTLAQSRSLANRLLLRNDLGPSGRINELYELTYSRPATQAEVGRATAYLERLHQSLAQSGIASTEIEAKSWTSLCRAVLAANEFVYVE